ncbi:MAG: enoyl-CoA hydratase/isomerase family protein [Pararhodobacter sp.]|nr:enoyl-CoA hydratase/isomerase family protein [Pararhodobacter sp.]
MEPEVIIRKEGAAGRITLNRPKALNALTHGICLETLKALDAWADDPDVRLLIIDGAGERAFCAGGDIAQVYHAGRAGNFALGRDFWRDEYVMNARLAEYGKPIVSLMHGFVMGGGVGYGCHVSHRVVSESTQMAMPECGIGLIPDVGGTHLLAHAPGYLGMHLGLTGARFGAGDAIHAGFADHHVPEADWPALIADLVATGDAGRVAAHAQAAPDAPLSALRPEIDIAYSDSGAARDNPVAYVALIRAQLQALEIDWAQAAAKAIARNSPLSMASTVAMLNALGPDGGLRNALRQEFRWTWRSMDNGDFLEGVRAQIIDKDRNPRWRHDLPEDLTLIEVQAMLASLGADELNFEEGEA